MTRIPPALPAALALALALVPAPVSPAPDAGDPWTPPRRRGDVWLWRLKGDPRVIGTLRSRGAARGVDWGRAGRAGVFEGVAERKRRALALVGVRDWTPERSSWTRRGGGRELAIEGTYTDHRSRRTSFVERHLFLEDATHQMLLVAPGGEAPGKDVVESFMGVARRTAFAGGGAPRGGGRGGPPSRPGENGP